LGTTGQLVKEGGGFMKAFAGLLGGVTVRPAAAATRAVGSVTVKPAVAVTKGAVGIVSDVTVKPAVMVAKGATSVVNEVTLKPAVTALHAGTQAMRAVNQATAFPPRRAGTFAPRPGTPQAASAFAVPVAAAPPAMVYAVASLPAVGTVPAYPVSTLDAGSGSGSGGNSAYALRLASVEDFDSGDSY
jgi:hypothetical protein